MNLLNLAYQNIRHRKLSSSLSILLLSFGCGLISLVLLAQNQLEKRFIKNIESIDMVVGAKGSPLQLILSAVYHIDAPTGNINLDEFEKLQKNALVKKAIPLSYGDSYQNFRILGTNADYLQLYAPAFLKSSKNFPHTGEVLVGAEAAARTGLKVNDTFYGSHGLQDAIESHESFTYKVVGIIPAQGNVVDKLIITNLQSVWAVHESHDEEEHASHEEAHDHDHEEGEHHTHEEGHLISTSDMGADEKGEKEITAALVQFKGAMARIMLPNYINDNTGLMAALPAFEVNRLFSLVADAVVFLQALAFVVILLSGISVFISLYQSLQARKGELALLRNLGASRWQLFTLICLEGLLIAFFSLLIAFLLSRGILYLLLTNMDLGLGLSPDWWAWLTYESYLVLAGFLISFFAALLPAIQAFYLNIPKTLSHA